MRYIIRIQLNYADSPDYTSLHAAMEKINFFKYINGETGIWYNLTTAMYYGSANRSAEQVRDYINDLIVELYSTDITPPENHEILIAQESDIHWILFEARKDDPNIPPMNRYLVAVI